MSRLRRIISGTAANGLNLGYLALVGVLTTPGMIMAWGANGYGVWLMLTSIPTYLALSDLGFSTAAMNAMAMSFARGEKDIVVETFHSLIALHLAAFAAIMGCAALALAVLGEILRIDVVQKYWIVILLLAAFSCLSMFSRVLLAGFRAGGHYTKGTLIYDAGQFAGNVIIIPVALLGGGYAACVIAWILVRLLTIMILWVSLRRTVQWLTIGVKRATMLVLRKLLHPAIGAMAIPGALALNQQGVAFIVGLVISPAATATLSSVRTASRLAIQVVSVVNRATIPELSAASARDDSASVKRILWINILAILALLLPIAAIFAFWGPQLVSIWTKGAIVPSRSFITLMAVGMLIHACWFFGTNLLMATNAHMSMISTLTGASIFAAVASWPVAHLWGLPGVALIAALAEAVCLARFISAARTANMSISLDLSQILQVKRGHP
ncbi:MAG: oligosaccharide flippase family protein [Pseudomonadota bacterium]